MNDLKVVKEKLSLDLFSARHENGQIENDKMESIIQLERTIRELENDLQVARVNFDQLSREKASGISQIDHKRIIRSIQNTFEEQLKLKGKFNTHQQRTYDHIYRVGVFSIRSDFVRTSSAFWEIFKASVNASITLLFLMKPLSSKTT